jgi:hypothetical protein
MRLALASLIVVVALASVRAEDAPKRAIEVRDRVNKIWDAQIEKIRGAQIAAKCKADAKKQYSAIRFKKRRIFLQNCIAQASR